MANYKVVDADQLDTDLTAVADAIREKTGGDEALSFPDGMVAQIKMIPDLIVNSDSGNPIALTDSSNMRLLGLKLFGKTTQDGTPTPEAPVELVSAGNGGSIGVTVAGKNLWNLGEELTVSQILSQQSVYIPKGTITISGIVTNDYADKDVCGVVLYAKDAKTRLAWVNVPKSVNGERCSRSFSIAEDCYYITLYGANEWKSEIYTAVYKDMQIEIGSTATTYEPYKEPQTLTVSTPNGLPGIPVTSGGNYTDEAGQQWVCDEVDFGRGVYVQRTKKYVIDENSAVKADTGLAWRKYVKLQTADNPSTDAFLCDRLPHKDAYYLSNVNTADKAGIDLNLDYNTIYFNIGYLMAEDTTQAARDVLAVYPITMLYALATPIETALSAEELTAYATLHTNYPNTTILNDGGAGMEVSYVADTKLYIDNQVAALSAAIVST